MLGMPIADCCVAAPRLGNWIASYPGVALRSTPGYSPVVAPRLHNNNAVAVRGQAHPSLLTALESFERRHDWGLIYPIKVELEVGR